jgi:hypothetical protein
VGAALSQHELGVTEQPVDCGSGQVLGTIVTNPGGVQVRGDGHRTSLVGGVDDSVERFSQVIAGRQHVDVVDDDQLAAKMRAEPRPG